VPRSALSSSGGVSLVRQSRGELARIRGPLRRPLPWKVPVLDACAPRHSAQRAAYALAPGACRSPLSAPSASVTSGPHSHSRGAHTSQSASPAVSLTVSHSRPGGCTQAGAGCWRMGRRAAPPPLPSAVEQARSAGPCGARQQRGSPWPPLLPAGIRGDALWQMITEPDELAMILMLTAAGTPNDRLTGLAPANTRMPGPTGARPAMPPVRSSVPDSPDPGSCFTRREWIGCRE
jgi:hypothetical protein